MLLPDTTFMLTNLAEISPCEYCCPPFARPGVIESSTVCNVNFGQKSLKVVACSWQQKNRKEKHQQAPLHKSSTVGQLVLYLLGLRTLALDCAKGLVHPFLDLRALSGQINWFARGASCVENGCFLVLVNFAHLRLLAGTSVAA